MIKQLLTSGLWGLTIICVLCVFGLADTVFQEIAWSNLALVCMVALLTLKMSDRNVG